MDQLLLLDLFMNQPYGPGAPWGGGGGHFFFGPLFGLVWLALAVFAVMWVVRRGRADRDRPDPRHSGASPFDILAERYARGEVSTEEYRERLEQLRGQP